MATYTSPPDLAELERDAWRRGDYATASLAGQLMDAKAEWARLENEGAKDANAALSRADAAEEERDKIRADVRDAIADLDRILSSIKRLPRRAELTEALAAIAAAAGV